MGLKPDVSVTIFQNAVPPADQTQCIFITKTNRSVLYIAVYCDKVQNMNRLPGQSAKFEFSFLWYLNNSFCILDYRVESYDKERSNRLWKVTTVT